MGTEGSLALPTSRLRSFSGGQPRSWFEPLARSLVAAVREDPLQRQLQHFCAVVRGQVAPLVSAWHGLQNLRVIDAILQAMRNGASVPVAEP